jgi:hypothetical protein
MIVVRVAATAVAIWAAMCGFNRHWKAVVTREAAGRATVGTNQQEEV